MAKMQPSLNRSRAADGVGGNKSWSPGKGKHSSGHNVSLDDVYLEPAILQILVAEGSRYCGEDLYSLCES